MGLDDWKKQVKTAAQVIIVSSRLSLSSQLYSECTWRVNIAAGLHTAAAGKQGALRGPEETAAPSGAAAPRAGGVQAPTAGRAPEAHRAAERAKEAPGGGEGMRGGRRTCVCGSLEN